jgi:hypothetical protein
LKALTPTGKESDSKGWRSVELPENLVAEVEELMKEKYERRPAPVALGQFIGDLIQESIEKARASEIYSSILEDYAIEQECIYIKDNSRDVVAELRFKDGADLYCNIDGAKNCVHIGYAWSIPAVQKLIWDKNIPKSRKS